MALQEQQEEIIKPLSFYYYNSSNYYLLGPSQVAQARQEPQVQSLGWEDPRGGNGVAKSRT